MENGLGGGAAAAKDQPIHNVLNQCRAGNLVPQLPRKHYVVLTYIFKEAGFSVKPKQSTNSGKSG